MFDKTPAALLFMLLAVVACLAQTPYKGLIPGKATRAEVENVLGRPVTQVSETLVEYAYPKGSKTPTFPITDKPKIYVQYLKGSPVVARIEILYPMGMESGVYETPKFQLFPGTSPAIRTSQDGMKVEEYWGAPSFFVSTNELKDINGLRVQKGFRSGFYSRELFQAAVQKFGIVMPPPFDGLGTWAGHDGEGRYVTYDFLVGHKLLLTHGGKTRQGTWKIKDDQISMEAMSDEGPEKYTGLIEVRPGKVAGELAFTMSGTNRGSRTVRWEATLGAPAESVGIGATVELGEDKQLTITSVRDNGPAARAGLKGGEVIVEIDRQSTAGMTVTSFVSLARGQAGTPVKLKIMMPDRKRTLEVTLLREAYMSRP